MRVHSEPRLEDNTRRKAHGHTRRGGSLRTCSSGRLSHGGAKPCRGGTEPPGDRRERLLRVAFGRKTRSWCSLRPSKTKRSQARQTRWQQRSSGDVPKETLPHCSVAQRGSFRPEHRQNHRQGLFDCAACEGCYGKGPSALESAAMRQVQHPNTSSLARLAGHPIR